MGDTIHLDPLDVYTLCLHLNKNFEELIDTHIGLHADNGIILPHILMDEARQCCTFLSPDGRCGIHAFRPGICRLFPLGRNYADGTFRYFIVEGGCDMPGKSKVRIEKWLGIPEIDRYEKFVCDWHYFLKDAREQLAAASSPSMYRTFSMYLMKNLYGTPYDSERDFYEQFYERLARFTET